MRVECEWNANAMRMQCERNANGIPVKWQQIANVTHAEMLLCSQAVEEHAIDPEGPFQIGGLGALVEAAVKSDRLVSFV